MNELTLGVAFPACNLNKKIIKQAIRKLKKYNFKLYLPEKLGIDKKHNPFRDTVANRTKYIEELFKNDEVNAIICARGGYGSHKIAEALNYDVIKQNPKAFIGYSDITVLLNRIHQETGIITQHGPMLQDLAFLDNKSFLRSLHKTLRSNFKNILETEQLKKCKIIKTGRTSGNLVGGNLATICSTIGTSNAIDFTDKIVFIEEYDEEIYAIDRYLTQLLQNKKILKAKALIFGDFTKISNKTIKYHQQLLDLVSNNFAEFKGPILWGYKAGHQHVAKFLPIGNPCRLELSDKKQTLTFL